MSCERGLDNRHGTDMPDTSGCRARLDGMSLRLGLIAGRSRTVLLFARAHQRMQCNRPSVLHAAEIRRCITVRRISPAMPITSPYFKLPFAESMNFDISTLGTVPDLWNRRSSRAIFVLAAFQETQCLIYRGLHLFTRVIVTMAIRRRLAEKLHCHSAKVVCSGKKLELHFLFLSTMMEI